MSSTTEQLRREYRLSSVHWQVLASRYFSRPVAASFEYDSFNTHEEWLLGKKACHRKTADQAAQENLGVSWPALLRYELEVRREAFREVVNTEAPSILTDAKAEHSAEARTEQNAQQKKRGRPPPKKFADNKRVKREAQQANTTQDSYARMKKSDPEAFPAKHGTDLFRLPTFSGLHPCGM